MRWQLLGRRQRDSRRAPPTFSFSRCTAAAWPLQEAARAESNVRFLAALHEPCARLAAAPLGEVPALLPGILDVLRMIFTLSPHHSDTDAIAALLRKVGE